MNDLNHYQIFVRHCSTMKKVSLDTGDGDEAYMTDSSFPVINFDEVKEEYAKELNLTELPKSNDALFENGKGAFVFVEFKNGYIDRSRQFALRKKIYDSILIFSDITSCRLSDLRKNMEYILVYNEKENVNNPDSELQQKQQKLKNYVQAAPSFDILARTIGKYAEEEYVCFGLKLFQNYCFKEVHTFTKKEFETYLSKL